MTAIPNKIELDKGCPTITLAGQAWPIPLFAFRQNKMIVPIIVRLEKGKALQDMTEAVMNDLGTLAFTALSRAHPQLTRNDFEDLAITLAELLGAIEVIAQQTGVMQPGEAKAPTTEPTT